MRHANKLDQAIDARRLSLDLSWTQLAQRAGISDVSLRNFRKGRSEPGPLSRRRIEEALDWEPGSVDAILAGGEATLRDSTDAVTVEDLMEARRRLLDALEMTDPREMREALADALAILKPRSHGDQRGTA